jgi:wyosine [tRNA(Phe)-imidazoG37] synthetase (radical SAM superfamily)
LREREKERKREGELMFKEEAKDKKNLPIYKESNGQRFISCSNQKSVKQINQNTFIFEILQSSQPFFA